MTAAYTNHYNHSEAYRRQGSGRRHIHTYSRQYSRTYTRPHFPAVLKKALFAAVVFFALLFIISGPVSRIFFSDTSVVEANQNLGEIQYKVVEIQKGDSLWTIARENMGPGYTDVYAYIRDIRECNQLKTNDITSGSYLMIPFYDTGAVDYASAE